MDRLFIGLPIANEAIASLQEAYNALSEYKNIVKIVPPLNYHITVQFLGDVDNGSGQKLVDDFSRLNTQNLFQKIPYKLVGLGAFPSLHRATVIWAGIKADLEKLSTLKKTIEGITTRYGIAKEDRKFTPHLTLARVRKDREIPGKLAAYIQDNKETCYAEAAFHKIVLYRSDLTREGPVYGELSSIELSKKDF